MKEFKILAESGKARVGLLETSHGKINTPFFMPVATKGSVKHLSMQELEKIGIECLISNSFLLSLKPGVEIIEEFGGIHNFISWQKPIFTDSGGFQVLNNDFVFSIDDNGVKFKDPFSGKNIFFTPEHAISIQNKIGSDVAMCLDDVPKATDSINRVEEAVERTFLWAKRCLDAHSNKKQLIFGICQGATNKKLREKSAKQISSLDFDGYAIGGLAIGETKEKMFNAVNYALPYLPKEKPRYLMGIGSIQELRKSISLGIDCFDSCFATRTGRHGRAFTTNGNINIGSSVFKHDKKPIEKNCTCLVCKNYSRAYIHHLFKTKEENAGKYLSYHNLRFIQLELEKIREEIIAGKFSENSH
ncbi:MAG: tRNA guanosine(34) transglycosylase Tgt [Candidatus Diapherotrites archaeon]